MGLQIIILILSVMVAGLVSWLICSKFYQDKIAKLRVENLELKSRVGLNENIVNQIRIEFSKIAQESLKTQQEELISQHSNDLKTRIELFKSEEINPINKLLKDFKDSIDNYQKTHNLDTLDIKNAISVAEKYAKALTTNQNSKGEFGENQLEQILKFANLKENIHYVKQYSANGAKPDFVIKLPNDKRLVIDSKAILKNYIEFTQTESDVIKKSFIKDLEKCIINLAKKNYEEISQTSQPGFILMYIPIEACVNLIYTDFDFKNIIELANSKNIIIIGTASLLVTLRLVIDLWAIKVRNDNIENIIIAGENLYNNISIHAQNLLNIQKAINDAAKSVQTEINRIMARHNGSIFKEAEKLRDYGINSKNSKNGKKLVEYTIPHEFLDEEQSEEI